MFTFYVLPYFVLNEIGVFGYLMWLFRYDAMMLGRLELWIYDYDEESLERTLYFVDWAVRKDFID
jgi:hypothetical protein